MVSIVTAGVEDAEEILALQHLAYQSEAALHDDYSIPPLSQTLSEIRAQFSGFSFLKAKICEPDCGLSAREPLKVTHVISGD